LIRKEQNLIKGIAEALGVRLERKQVEEALWESEERFRSPDDLSGLECSSLLAL
jgi:GAF domain-containing protein